jgi:hypothetical protein
MFNSFCLVLLLHILTALKEPNVVARHESPLSVLELVNSKRFHKKLAGENNFLRSIFYLSIKSFSDYFYIRIKHIR